MLYLNTEYKSHWLSWLWFESSNCVWGIGKDGQLSIATVSGKEGTCSFLVFYGLRALAGAWTSVLLVVYGLSALAGA